MRNKRFPNYPDDTDYTTNAPSYYDDLARKQKLVQLLAEKIWDYDQELAKRFDEWDKNLEKFPDNVEILLQQWLDDGTLDHIINDTIFNWKLDTTIFEIFRDEITEQIKNKSQGIYNIADFGAIGDGVTDDTSAIFEAVAKANNDGGIVVIPNGRFKFTSTIVLHEGARMVGLSLPSTWTTKNRGSILEYHGNSVAVQYGDHTDIGGISNGALANFQVVDVLKTGTIGVLVGGTTEKWVHDVVISQVMTDYFDVGFEIAKAYGINADLCISNRPRMTGWHLPAQSGSLTTSTFTNCGGYNSLGNGWVVGRAITYSSFDNCYFDGSEIAFYMTGYTNNQNFLNNFGAENYRSGGIEINSPSFLGGINSPVLVNTKLKEDGDNIRVRAAKLYLKGWYNPNVYSPVSGYDLNMLSGTATLENCTFQKMNGLYDGDRHTSTTLNKFSGANALNYRRIDSTQATHTHNIANTSHIIGTASTITNRTIFNGMSKGQVINVYGISDTNKLYLAKYDFPELLADLQLGKGDYVQFIYDDFGDGLKLYPLIINVKE